MRSVNSILDEWFKRSPAARAARDARAALDARDARDARDALDARAARVARAALVARDALDARDARESMQRFAAWCLQVWWWYGWDLSWIVTTHFGADQLGKPVVDRWAKPLFEAFVAGAWLLYWTDDTLYWVAKPKVSVERDDRLGMRRLHHQKYAALESDIENLYFWHGVMVPAFVVVRPDWITAKHVTEEPNVEVRRVMLERMGVDRFMAEVDAKIVHEDKDQLGKRRRLLRVEQPNDEALVAVEVTNSTEEPDGTWKNYLIRVDPGLRDCASAVAWTFGMSKEEYQPSVES